MTIPTLAALAAATTIAAQVAAAPPDSPSASVHQRLLYYLDEQRRERPVTSVQDWQRRRQQILAGMQDAMGPLPNRGQFPPLDVRETNREPGDGYLRITLSYAAHLVGDAEDRVPAHLYLPLGASPARRRPGVLALHQTSPQGKANVGPETKDPQLAYAVELARRGYVVLAPDYPSFGDYRYDFDRDRYVSGTMKGIVNHIRGIDLLAARPEVDAERMGTIGHSLGGHNAMFVAAFDQRLKVVVSSCGWTPFHDYYDGKLAGWTSARYMPRLRDVYKLDPNAVPFDFHEVVASLAPRAFYSNSPTGDSNFAVAGVKKATAEAAKVYQLHAAADKLLVRHPDCGHDFPQEIRKEAYEFMDRQLKHSR